MIFKFLFVLLLVFSLENNFIENEFVNVLTNWTLLEETKKKKIYGVSFEIINKKNKNIYYIGSRSKNINRPIEDQTSLNKNIDNNNRNEKEAKVTTSVQMGSSYVDSGGALSVGDQSSLSGGGSGRSDVTERKGFDLKTSKSNFNIQSNEILTHFFSFNNNNSKNLKFFLYDNNLKSIPIYSNSSEIFSYFITLNNVVQSGIIDESPIICQIPPEGLVYKSKIEISKKTNQKPDSFTLSFTKDEIYVNKMKLLIDKTFHIDMNEAIEKYYELQKIRNESL
tara:strand:- start:96 stop:935 length:840 start_codon:yes stop_codon:yes gene_type:complete